MWDKMTAAGAELLITGMRISVTRRASKVQLSSAAIIPLAGVIEASLKLCLFSCPHAALPTWGLGYAGVFLLYALLGMLTNLHGVGAPLPNVGHALQQRPPSDHASC
jgi:hypothetical protein